MSDGESSIESYYQDAVRRLDKANKRISDLEKERNEYQSQSVAHYVQRQIEQQRAKHSQARLSEAVKVLEEVADRLEQIRGEFVVHRFDIGTIRYDSTSGTSGRIVSYSEEAMTTVKAFLDIAGEDNEA